MKLTFGKKMGIMVGMIAVIGLAPLGTLGYLSILESEEALETEAFHQLTAVREIKKKTIETYFTEREGDIEILAETTTRFTDFHAEEAFFQTYIKTYGYADVYLLEPDGLVEYSTGREADYETNIMTGPYRDSNLGKLFRKVVKINEFAMVDFEPYEPAGGEPASFIGHPIWDKDQNILGVLVLEIHPDAVNAIMGIRDGMGETGESYLVGPDLLMRSDSFLDPVNHTIAASFANPTKGSVKTRATEMIFVGKAGAEVIMDYNGAEVLSAYTPITFHGITWGLIAEVDMAEVDIPIDALANQIYLIAGVSGIFVILTMILVAWQSTGEVTFLTKVVRDLASSSDQVAAASTQISSGAQTVSQGATEQAANLEEISSSVEEISTQSKGNTESADMTSIAAAQMAGLVQQSHENAKQASTLSVQASHSSEEGVKAMAKISSSMQEIKEGSEKITDIIEVINEITHQTKMLATNAAIEAARAGDQGKGFAVVADEVSKLAESSKQSAKEISALIKESAQKAKAGADYVETGNQVLQQIFQHSEDLSKLLADISNYSDQQLTGMEGMEQQVNNIKLASDQQSTGIVQVSESIIQLDQVTQSNAANAEESAAAAEELNAQAETLKVLVEGVSDHFGVKMQHGGQTIMDETPQLMIHHDPVQPMAHNNRHKVINPKATIPMKNEFQGF